MRVLVTGMGGELGTRVAQLLEERDRGPRDRRASTSSRRAAGSARSEFQRIDPRDREKLTDVRHRLRARRGRALRRLRARLAGRARDARAEYTQACTVAALGAAARTGQLERVALRSGLEVYGRGRGRPRRARRDGAGRADHAVRAHAASRSRRSRSDLGRRHDVPGRRAADARPIAGSHVPCPLGRLLRLPVVPCPRSPTRRSSCSHQEDAARAMVAGAAARRRRSVQRRRARARRASWQAVRLGGRVPWPVVGPGWRVATRVAELARRAGAAARRSSS